MVFTRKFSEFVPGNVNEVVGITAGANTIGPGGGGASITYTFTQATAVVPPLYLGAAVRVDVASGLWETTLATTKAGAEFLAFITDISGDTYTVQFAGPVLTGIPLGGLAVFVPGTPYYLSDTVAGGISTVPPAINSEVDLPVLWGMDNGNPVIRMSRGFVVGGSGGGGTSPQPNNVATVTQNPNTFALGDALYIQADQTFAKANAYSTLAASQAEWVVTSIVTPGVTFTIQQGGKIQGLIVTDDVGAAIASGPIYYVSPIVGQEGKLTSIDPGLTPGQYSKPFYVQQVLSSNTGWLLDQRPEFGSKSAPVFMGRLDNNSPDGPYADANIFNNSGGPFKSYSIIFNPNIINGHGLSATGPNPITIGFQFAFAGVFYTGTAYQATLNGVNNSAGAVVPTLWGFIDTTGSGANVATIFPNIPGETGTRVAMSAYEATLTDNGFGGGMAVLGRGYFTDWSVGNAPSNHNFTSMGFSAGGPGGAGNYTSGIRLVFEGVGAAIFDGTQGYFTIWGIPNS